LAIGDAAASRILMNALHLIRNLLQQWILSAVDIEGVPEKACAQHKRVLQAIERRDGTAARKEMRKHLQDMAGFVPQKQTARRGTRGRDR
jgi:GntR family transcriptional regulator, transcriptional repressor for pyruvate dehydrogenase complex